MPCVYVEQKRKDVISYSMIRTKTAGIHFIKRKDVTDHFLHKFNTNIHEHFCQLFFIEWTCGSQP